MPEVVEVLLWITGIGVATTVVGVGSVWYGVRRLTRSKGVRRRIEQGELNVRALSSDPTVREVAKHRLAMRRSTDATERALAAAKEAGRPVGDLPQVAADLDRAYREIDDDLRVVENEPDAAMRHRLLTDLLPDIRTHERLSGDLRRSLLHSRSSSTPALQRAADDLMLEAQALGALGEGEDRGIERRSDRVRESDRVRRSRRRAEDD
ncbi:hypothetical protein ACPYO6_00240 [Georgenia sp. Z1344]|uniref:hypothetical protein n=1 Tax=Georgenia sp. Z1344 TaxID=3416706 RepID=UPI003CEC7B45